MMKFRKNDLDILSKILYNLFSDNREVAVMIRVGNIVRNKDAAMGTTWEIGMVKAIRAQR